MSKDDLQRTTMYQENVKRKKLQLTFLDYKEYLMPLEMKGEIQCFVPIYMSRIAQNADYITLYDKSEDKFGDNGVVSTVIGKIQGIIATNYIWNYRED